MRYQSSSAISYFFRNFWHYILLVLPVVLFMTFFANFGNQTAFLKDWLGGNLFAETYITQMMNKMSIVNQANNWLFEIGAFLLLVTTFSLITVKMSRHMRVGDFVPFPVKSAIKIIPSMAIFCGCFTVVCQLLQFVVFGILFLLNMFFAMDAVIVVGLVLLWLAVVGIAYLWMLMLLAFPLFYSENYPFNVALSYSIREMSKHSLLCIGYAVGYAVAQVAVLALDYILPVSKYFVHAIFFTFVIYYIPCLALTIHHKTLGSERKDISRVLIG